MEAMNTKATGRGQWDVLTWELGGGTGSSPVDPGSRTGRHQMWGAAGPEPGGEGQQESGGAPGRLLD